MLQQMPYSQHSWRSASSASRAVRNDDGGISPFSTGPIEVYEANLSSSDPYLFYHFHEALTPGHWWLSWQLHYQTCDVEALTDHSPFSDEGVFSYTSGWSRMFTISNSTSAPDKEVDLVAATANDSCPDDLNAVIINVTDTTMQSPSNLNLADRDTCAVTTNSTSGTPVHTPNPCSVSISPEMAAGISANLTYRRCRAIDAPDDCPENAAQPLMVLGVSGLLATIGAAAFTIVHSW